MNFFTVCKKQQIILLQAPEDVDAAIEEKNNACEDKQQKPFMLSVGPPSSEPEASTTYNVAFGNVRLKCDTIIEALDACLKSFQTYNCDYPKQRSGVWLLMQKCCLQIVCKKSAVQVSKVIGFIEGEAKVCVQKLLEGLS